MSSFQKKYLGDGVYLDSDGYHYILYTSDGVRETNRIYLDPSVAKALKEIL